MKRVHKSTNGCWHWTGHVDPNGYGHYSFTRDGKRTSTNAHRWAYEYANGPLIPPGEPGHQQVDHECHNRSKSCQGGRSCPHRRCVNPAHLAAKTPKHNVHASRHTLAAANRAKTHCIRGHELSGDNLRGQNGKRYCYTCHLTRGNEARRKRNQAKRGEGWERRYWQREVTHCPRGHSYSGDNLRIASNGQRQCRACMAENQARYRARKKVAH